MNLKTYFDLKGKSRRFCNNFPKQFSTHSIKEIWDNFISLTLADKKSVIAWHNLLVKYIFETENPILFCRLYEGGGYKDKRNGKQIDEIRRTALTIDGNIKYMFVSNYDAAEMFNVVFKNVDADIKMFSNMIDNKEYKLHYQASSPINDKNDYLKFKKTGILPYGFNSKSIQEEFYVLSGYPLIGNVYGSILNNSNRYLAHIIGVRATPYLLPSGKLVDGSYLGKILDKGDLSDWSNKPNCIRKINTNLSNDDISIIKAHFLRFFDPLNYFATPSEKHHIHYGTLSKNKNVGEYWEVQEFVEKQYEKIYGKKVMDEFRKYALVPKNIDEKFETKYKFDKVDIGILINRNSKVSGTIKSNSTKQILRDNILMLAKNYIANKNVDSFNDFDAVFPGLSKLSKDIEKKNDIRFHKEEILLQNGDIIRISNQIGDKPNFPKNRNYSLLVDKFKTNGITL